MFDCFNMAYQDKRNALQLNIKVNSENLLPHPQKCNAGSLRVPADPSWPKIPQRKLVDDFSNTIEQPCVVTLTGSPRRSRTTVQTPLNQSPKSAVTKDSTYSSINYQRNTSSIHTLKKFSGYVDPRFKKVTSTKRNQDVTETRMNQGNMKTFDNEEMKIVSERDSNKHRVKALDREQFYDTNKIKDPNAKVVLSPRQSMNSEGSKNMNSNETPVLDQKKNVENILEKRCENDANVQVDATSLPVQENNGQLLLLVDKKLQPHPLNAIQLDTITVPQEYLKQCYNVQVPILTYKNIPVPIPAVEVNNIIQQCPISSEQKNETTIAPSSKKVVDQGVHAAGSKSLTQVKQAISVQKKNMNKSLVNEAETIIAEEKHACVSKPGDTLKVPNPVTSEHRNSKHSNANLHEKLETSNVHRRLLESSDSEYYIPSMVKRKFHNSTLQHVSIKKNAYNTSGGETTDSEFILLKNVQKKEYTDANKLATKHHKMGPYNYEQPTVSKERSDCVQSSKLTSDQDQSQQDHKKNGYETKGRNKSEQNLPCARNECTKKLYRSSEPHITFKQKMRAPRKISRKARSYFQKNSHSALVDSDYTSAWPNCQSNKYRCSQTNIQKFSSHRTKRIGHSNAKLSVQENRTNMQTENSSNPVEQSYFRSDHNISSCHKGIMSLSKTCSQNNKCKCDMSPRSITNDTIESPKCIPPKTQELLNKSYWEYYNKLKHKLKNTDNVDSQYLYELTMNAADTANETPVEVYDTNFQKPLNPEFQTLQQCSALSSMINKALDSNLQSNTVQTSQLYLNGNVKSSTNPLVDTQNASTNNIVPQWVNNGEPVLHKVRYKKANENDRQYLELKSIIFFGGIMYILIIFLPMLYEYFYHEVQDDYENLGYLEFIVEYILSSFKEAFGGVFSGVKQIFFYPPACKKCNNIV